MEEEANDNDRAGSPDDAQERKRAFLLRHRALSLWVVRQVKQTASQYTCARMQSRLYRGCGPNVAGAAAMCIRGCNGTCQRLRPHALEL